MAISVRLLTGSRHAVVQFFEALRYKPEGRGFDSRWCHWHNPSDRTLALGLTQPLAEISTRNISWWQRWPVRRADKFTTFMCRLSWNLEASTSWNPQGLSSPVMELLYLSDRVAGQLIIIMKRDVELYVTIHSLKHVFKETVENNSCDLLT